MLSCYLEAAEGTVIADYDFADWLEGIMKKEWLSKYEKMVMRLKYIANCRESEIAKAIGYTQGRINQMHTAAINKMRLVLSFAPQEFFCEKQNNFPAGFSPEKPNDAGTSQGYANGCGVSAQKASRIYEVNDRERSPGSSDIALSEISRRK
jgi:hypothetical protein